MLARTLLSSAALLSLVALGCKPPAALDPEAIAKHKGAVMLAEEPTGAVTPVDLRDEEFQKGEVVLVGQVGGVANPWKQAEPAFPFKAGEATFFLVDPGVAAAYADHASDDPDHDENCPFCARGAKENADAIAIVTFTDAAGKPIRAGAEQMLGLAEGDVVVVRGPAKLVGELLIVEAKGIYIRQ